jgi:hypothetical protein
MTAHGGRRRQAAMRVAAGPRTPQPSLGRVSDPELLVSFAGACTLVCEHGAAKARREGTESSS